MDASTKQKLNDILSGSRTITSVASELGVSRQTVHKWLRRYKREEALGAKKVTVAHNRVPSQIENLVVAAAEKYPEASVTVLGEKLRQEYKIVVNPSTIFRILKRNKVRYAEAEAVKTAVPQPKIETIPASVEVADVAPVTIPESVITVPAVEAAPIMPPAAVPVAEPKVFVEPVSAAPVASPFTAIPWRLVGETLLALVVVTVTAFSLFGARHSAVQPLLSQANTQAIASPSFDSYGKVFTIAGSAEQAGFLRKFILSPRTFSLGSVMKTSAPVPKNGPRLAEIAFLPLKSYASFALGGESAKAQSGKLAFENAVPLIDRLSLKVFCTLSTSLDSDRCDYNKLIAFRNNPTWAQPSVNSKQSAVNTGNASIRTTATTTASLADLYNTFNNASASPVYITKYITEYVGVPGPAGANGRNGKDGTNGTNALAIGTSQVAPSYSGYIYPSTPTAPVGVSTISYLKDTAIDNPNISNGLALNLFLTTPTLKNAVFNGYSLFNDTAEFAGTAIANNFVASSSQLLNATLTNATTTNAYISNLFVNSATSTNSYVSNLIAASSTLTDAMLTNSTTTNAYIANLVAASSTLADLVATNATTTNFIVENSTTTNAFIQNLTIGNQSAGDALFTNATTTTLFATSTFLVNATTTNLFTQNLSVGNANIQGDQTVTGAFAVTGTSTLGSNVYLNGNVVVGTSSNEMLTVNALINSNVAPAQNKMYDLGSPSFYWRNVYADSINVNTISAASTTISGTSNNTFTINSDNNTNDGEDSTLVFFRGLVTPNALLRWNSVTERLESNMSFKVQNETPSIGTTTLTVQAGAGQGSTNMFELLDYSGNRLSVFDANGRLGIGKSSPSAPLDVKSVGTTTFSGIRLENQANGNITGTMYEISSGIGALELRRSGFQGARIVGDGSSYIGTPSGNGLLGMNTTTPDAILAIQGDLNKDVLLSLHPANAQVNNLINIYNSSNVLTSVLTAAGNLGLGTSTPSTNLSIVGNTIGTGVGINITNTSNSASYARLTFNAYQQQSDIFLDGTGGFIAGGGLIERTSTNVPIIFFTNSTEKARITSSGNVGIGTTSPVSMLSVQASSTPLTSPFISFNSTTSPIFNVLASGNVGIGTANPAYMLDVNGQSRLNGLTYVMNGATWTTNGWKKGMRFDTTNAIELGGGGTTMFGTGVSANSLYQFYTTTEAAGGDSAHYFSRVDGSGNISLGGSVLAGGAPNLYIQGTNTGNVGIGTSTPGSLLTIASSTAVGTSDLFSVSASTSPIFDVLANGNVGIGTAGSNYNLSIIGGPVDTTLFYVGDPTYQRFSIGTSVSLYPYPSAGAAVSLFAYNNGGTARNMASAISSGTGEPVLALAQSVGNVGIGTTTPSTKLDVNGTIRSTGWNTATTGTGIEMGYWASGGYGTIYTYNRDTGSYLDTVLGTGGNQLYLKSSGNVGIGTTTPDRKLTVRDDNSIVQADFVGQNPSGLLVDYMSAPNANYVGQRFYQGSGVGALKGFVGYNNSTSNFAIGASQGGTEWLSINSSGNVGIGTTSPTTANLVVEGAGTQASPSSVEITTAFQSGGSDAKLSLGQNPGTGDLSLLVAGTDTRTDGLTANDSYITASQRLDLWTKGDGTVRNAGIQIGDSWGSAYGGMGFYTNNPNATGSLRMVINNGGNVGIGTTSPDANFSVKGSVNSGSLTLLGSFSSGNNSDVFTIGDNGNLITKGTLKTNFNGVDTTGTTVMDKNGTGGAARLYGYDGSGNMNYMFNANGVSYLNGGNVGIGTSTPGNELEVYASSYPFIDVNSGTGILRMGEHTGSNYGMVGTVGAQDLRFMTNNIADRMTITSGGSVGIGTTTPGALVDIYSTSSILPRVTTNGGTYAGWSIYNGSSEVARYAWNTAAGAYILGDATNGITFYNHAGNTRNVVIQDGGNVGIGTTSPIAMFSVQASSTPLTSPFISFNSTTTPIFNVLANGNVGIGTANPTVGLDVENTAFFNSNNSVQGNSFRNLITLGNNTNHKTQTNQGSAVTLENNMLNSLQTTTALAINSYQLNGGNTVAQLELNRSSANAIVQAAVSTGQNLGVISFGGSDGTDFKSAAHIVAQVNGTVSSGKVPGDLLFATANSNGVMNEWMRITSGGNVGIGTTSPSNTLTVETSANGKGIDFDSNGTIIGSLTRTVIGSTVSMALDGAAGRPISINNGSNSSVLLANGGGNVGIGTTTPTFGLTVAVPNNSLSAGIAQVASSNGYSLIQALNSGGYGLFGVADYTGVSAIANGLPYATVVGSNNSTPLQLATNGISRMVIDTSGRVGIGTTTPGAKLDVQDSNVPTVRTSDGSGRIAEFRGPSGSQGAAIGTVSNNSFNFISNNNVRMTLDPTGNLGIGTSSPVSLLSVQASSTPLTSPFISFNSTTSPIFNVLANGNVGIGISNPQAPLDISGTLQTSSYANLGGFIFGNGTYAVYKSGAAKGSIQFPPLAAGGAQPILLRSGDGAANTGGYVDVSTDGASMMRVTNTAVGISTTTPTALLTVASSTANGTSNLFSVATTTPIFNVLANGNVGIGTSSPSYALVISSNLSNAARWIGNGSAQGVLYADNQQVSVGSANNYDMGLMVSGSDKLHITTGGNVGIGTTTPTKKLSVAQNGTLVNSSSGSIEITSTDSNEKMSFGYDTTGLFGYIFAANQGVAYRNLALSPLGGNVGIGTTTPSSTLTVAGKVTVAGVGSYATGLSQLYNTAADGLTITGQAGTTYDMLFANSNGSTFLKVPTGTINAIFNGNVGIGTTTPQAKLHVAGGNMQIGDANMPIGNNPTFTMYGYYNAGTTTTKLTQSVDISGNADILTTGRYLTLGSANYIQLNNVTNLLGNLLMPNATPIQMKDSSGASYKSVLQVDALDGVQVGGISGGWSSSTLKLYAGSAERMRIANDGSIGIGTTTPGALLTVSSSTASGTSNLFSIGTTTQFLNVFANGNVGIGTTYGAGALEVYRSGNTTQAATYIHSSDYGLYVGTESTSTNRYAFNVATGISGGTPTGGTNAFTVRADGNVGIGSYSPGQRLEVYQNGNTGTAVAALHASDYGLFVGTESTSTSRYALNVLSGLNQGSVSGGNSLLYVRSDGNVGIGTTNPGVALDVTGYIRTNNGVRVASGYSLLWGSTGSDVFIQGDTTAHTLAINTNGAERMRVDSTGDVIIGTSTSALQSGGTGITLYDASYPEIKFINSTTGPLATDGTALVLSGTTFTINNREGPLAFGTSNTERMRLDSVGNLGIGTTTPVSMLSVMASSTPLTSPFISFNSTTTPIFNVLANGNVGIGTTAPNYDLDVNGGINAYNFGSNLGQNSAASFLAGQSGASGVYSMVNFGYSLGKTYSPGAVGFQTTDSTASTKGDLVFAVRANTSDVAPAEIMRITSAGNVGIGTTTPNSKLEVNQGMISITGPNNNASLPPSNIPGLHLSYNLNQSIGYIASKSQGVAWQQLNLDGSVVAINTGSSGNVGIGTTTPVQKLSVVGSSYFKGVIGINALADTTIATLRVDGSNASSSATFMNGNVGIGTTTPQSLLSVVSGSTNAYLAIDSNPGSQAALQFGKTGVQKWVEYVPANSNDLRLFDGTSDRITFLNGGNVGIGTTTPGSSLTVQGNSSFMGNALISNNLTFGTSSTATIGMVGNNLTLNSYAANPIKVDFLQVTSGLEYGVVFQYGDLTLKKAAGVDTYIRSNAQDLRLQSDPGYNLLLNPTNGNVGIGTTSPQQLLEVASASAAANPTIRISGWNSGAGAESSLSFYENHYVNAEVAKISTLRDGTGATNSALAFSTYNGSLQEAMRIDKNGNVGIGTTTPGSRLTVYNPTATAGTDLFQLSSDVSSTGNIVFRVQADGSVFSDAGATIGSPADVAESYPATEAVDAGTVVAFSTTTVTWSATQGSATSTASSSDLYEVAGVRKATTGAEAFGVISTRPGLHLGADMPNGVPVALSGRVPVKVTTENGDIHSGDYLTVSTTMPGYAMKLTGEGRSIGRAVSDSVQGRDKVMMVVETGYQKVDTTGKYATTTGMLTTGNVDLNANGVAIYNIKSIASANGSWSIDENGRITAKSLEVQQLCVGTVCVTQDQFLNMVEQTNTATSSANSGIVAGTSTTNTATSDQLPVTSNTTNTASSSTTTADTTATTTDTAAAPITTTDTTGTSSSTTFDASTSGFTTDTASSTTTMPAPAPVL